MGFFSWKTCDTDKSIPNKHCRHKAMTVYLLDDEGNKWACENNYDGYGVFGDQDYYVLVDKMNGGVGDRDNGIHLELEVGEPDIKLPRLVEDPTLRYEDLPKPPEHCPYQGYFY